MADWELLDQHSGMRTYLGGGDDDDTVLVKREFDPAHATAHLSQNRAMQNDDFDRKSEMWHAASIPISVMYEWLHKFGVNAWDPRHADGVRKLLNSSDYRWCKVKHIIL